MPILTRSNVKRNYIEAETPRVTSPKDVQKKRRKLDKELSTQCLINEELQISYERSVCRGAKTRTEKAEVVWKERCVPSRRKKGTRQTNQDNDENKKAKLKKAQKGKNKVSKEGIGSSNDTCASPETSLSKSEVIQEDSNQRRVNRAIQNIAINSAIHDAANCENYQEKVNDISLVTAEVSDNIVDQGQGEISSKRRTAKIYHKVAEEEDYQKKYFKMLDMMKNIQDKFLLSQKNFEEHVSANDEFLDEMNLVLKEKNKELMMVTKELEMYRIKNAELENRSKTLENDVRVLTRKIDEVEMIQKVSGNEPEAELQSIIGDQNSKLEFYKLLTGLSLEREPTGSPKQECLTACDSFLCVFKDCEAKEMKFALSQDREFAEIQYIPCGSQDEEQSYSSLPSYLQEQIFFADEQAPKFLLRLLRAVHEPGKKQR